MNNDKLKEKLLIMSYEIKTYKSNNLTSEHERRDFKRIESLMDEISGLVDELPKTRKRKSTTKTTSESPKTSKGKYATSEKTITSPQNPHEFIWRGRTLDKTKLYRIVYRPNNGVLESAIFMNGEDLVDNDVFLGNEQIVSVMIDDED